jgi:hypothetical protein
MMIMYRLADKKNHVMGTFDTPAAAMRAAPEVVAWRGITDKGFPGDHDGWRPPRWGQRWSLRQRKPDFTIRLVGVQAAESLASMATAEREPATAQEADTSRVQAPSRWSIAGLTGAIAAGPLLWPHAPSLLSGLLTIGAARSAKRNAGRRFYLILTAITVILMLLAAFALPEQIGIGALPVIVTASQVAFACGELFYDYRPLTGRRVMLVGITPTIAVSILVVVCLHLSSSVADGLLAAMLIWALVNSVYRRWVLRPLLQRTRARRPSVHVDVAKHGGHIGQDVE